MKTLNETSKYMKIALLSSVSMPVVTTCLMYRGLKESADIAASREATTG